MRNNPRNVRPDELDTVMRAAGFTSRQKGTSHKYYTDGVRSISIPQRKPHLRPEYVLQALALLGGDEDGDGGEGEENGDGGDGEED